MGRNLSNVILENNGMNGYVDIKLENIKTGEIVYEGRHNFISDAMKRLALAQSMSLMMVQSTGSPFGMLWNFLNYEFNYNSTSGGFIQNSSVKDRHAIVLLNLGNSKVYNSEDKYIPIIGSNGAVDYSKVIGYANGRLASTNVYEGRLDNTTGSVNASMNSIGNSVIFDTDEANGTFDHVAVMPGFENNNMRSLLTFKCISNYNYYEGGSKNIYGYIRPGVTDGTNVLTASDEIILFFERNNNNIWIYNITTGLIKPVGPDNDLLYNYNYNNLKGSETSTDGMLRHQVVCNGKLYGVNSSNYMQALNISNGSYAKTNIIAESRIYCCGCWVDGTDVYASYAATQSGYNGKVFKINTTTDVATSTLNTSGTYIDNVPDNWNIDSCGLNKIGDKIYVYNYEQNKVIECTDPLDVKNTIVGVLPTTATNGGFVVNNKNYFIHSSSIPVIQMGSESEAGGLGQKAFYGTWISDDNYSNYWSLAKTDGVKEKTDEVRALITYGYKFE